MMVDMLGVHRLAARELDPQVFRTKKIKNSEGVYVLGQGEETVLSSW